MRLTMFFPVAAVGAAAGFTSALLGVGGGIIMVPAMILLFHTEAHRAVATSLAAMLPIIGTGLIRHYGFGNVDARMALILAAGGVLGAWLGAGLAARLPGQVLQRIFGALLLAVALRMLLGR